MKQIEAEMKGSRRMNKEQFLQLKYLKSEIKMLKEQIINLDYTATTDFPFSNESENYYLS